MNMYEHLKGKRLLALDIGKKRIGIAVCDILHITTTPLKTIDNTSNALQEIIQIAQHEQVVAIIIGIPPESEGQSNAIITEIKKFQTALSEIPGLDIILHDESFSSKRAVEHLIASGRSKSHRKNKAMIDKTAAAIILRSFLDEYEHF
jgi:putative Holliday junction resolvase